MLGHFSVSQNTSTPVITYLMICHTAYCLLTMVRKRSFQCHPVPECPGPLIRSLSLRSREENLLVDRSVVAPAMERRDVIVVMDRLLDGSVVRSHDRLTRSLNRIAGRGSCSSSPSGSSVMDLPDFDMTDRPDLMID